SVRIYRSQYHLGEVATDLAELDRAERLLSEALPGARRAGDPRGTAIAAADLGRVLLLQGSPDGAVDLYHESIQKLAELGDHRRLSSSLLGLASVLLALGHRQSAARLGGAAEAISATVVAALPTGSPVALQALLRELERMPDAEGLR